MNVSYSSSNTESRFNVEVNRFAKHPEPRSQYTERIFDNTSCSRQSDLSTLTQEEEEVTKNGQEVCSNGPEQASTLLGSTKPNLGLSNKWSLSTSVMATPSRPIKTIKTNWTTKYPSRFESAINKLQGITEVASQGLLQAPATVEDQYDAFSKHIASQMRELPIRSHFAT
ncbi:hypothetical protein J6590_088874 [Homalodisca vitripennis]|nr:hypothetical protein J6590_088874 [Homalodisca vitripennis]